MSDHDAPDESGTNRAWLSAVLLTLVIGMAAGSGLINAAPQARQPLVDGRTGVLVLDDAQGTVLRGVVVVRGSTLALIQGERGEIAVARDRVRYFRVDNDELGDDYWEAFPPGSFATTDRRQKKQAQASKPAAAPSSGCVVLNAGTVLIGSIAEHSQELVVTTQDGVTTRVPRSAVRWHKIGVVRPTADYWAAHGSLTIDPRFRLPGVTTTAAPSPETAASNAAYREAAKRNPKISLAILAQKGSDWGPAVGLWLQVYRDEGFEDAYFENVSVCSRKWVELALRPFRRDALLKRFETLFEVCTTHGVMDRPEVKALLAERLDMAAHGAMRVHRPKTAHELVQKMASLGGDYVARSDALWDELNGRGPLENEPTEKDD